MLSKMVCQVKLFRDLFSGKALGMLWSGAGHTYFEYRSLRVEESLQFWTLKLGGGGLQSCFLNCRSKLYKIFL